MNPMLVRLRRELSRPRLFDEGIEAARNACVAGASIASAAIVAAAYYDSPLVGILALTQCMQRLAALGSDLDAWFEQFQAERDPETCHKRFAPGFGYVTNRQAAHIRRACQRCAETHAPARCSFSTVEFYLRHVSALTRACGPLNIAGLMALVCTDQAIPEADAERYLMLWRIDTAIGQAQNARRAGLGVFPFLTEVHEYEGPWPAPLAPTRHDYLLEIGLEQEGA